MCSWRRRNRLRNVQAKLHVRNIVGSELSFLKLVSVLVGLSRGVSNFSSRSAQLKLLLLRLNVCLIGL